MSQLGVRHVILGNLPEIFQSQAGVPDFKYQRIFGDVVRIKGPFGVWKFSPSIRLAEIEATFHRKIGC